PDPADPRIAEAVRSGVPDARRGRERHHPLHRAVHLRGRLRELPLRLLRRDLVRVLRPHRHHRRRAGPRGARQEGAVMSTATLSPTQAVTLGSTRRSRHSHLPGQKPFAPLRVAAFVILALLAIGWLLPFLWA